MLEWNAEAIAKLYQLHKRYVAALRRDVIEVNRSLGSSNPTKSDLVCLTRAQFESLVKGHGSDSENVQLWIRRMIRGNEHEFPELQAAG
jgi:hypothetical protein